MRLLLFIVSALFLTACSQQHFSSAWGSLTDGFSEPSLQQLCDEFPYDDSDTACNLYGWQHFAYQTALHTQSQHQQALMHLGATSGDSYKRLILLSQPQEALNVRLKATQSMLAIASKKDNSFGQFFFLLANHYQQDVDNKRQLIYLNADLKSQKAENKSLQQALIKNKAKIQAIMDIEENLNTN